MYPEQLPRLPDGGADVGTAVHARHFRDVGLKALRVHRGWLELHLDVVAELHNPYL
jgi:hypothetical protein